MTVVGLVLALWATTSAATTLMKGVTRAFDGTTRRGFVRKRLDSLVIVACLVGRGRRSSAGCSCSARTSSGGSATRSGRRRHGLGCGGRRSGRS